MRRNQEAWKAMSLAASGRREMGMKKNNFILCVRVQETGGGGRVQECSLTSRFMAAI